MWCPGAWYQGSHLSLRPYTYRPNPIAFMSFSVNTSCRMKFCQRITNSLNKLHPTEESDRFHFLHKVCLSHLKGSVGLILDKDSAMKSSCTQLNSRQSVLYSNSTHCNLSCMIHTLELTTLLCNESCCSCNHTNLLTFLTVNP